MFPLHINPLNAELNPIRHLLALVGICHIVHVSRITVKNQAGLNFQCYGQRMSFCNWLFVVFQYSCRYTMARNNWADYLLFISSGKVS
jgi:hypothetical protein